MNKEIKKIIEQLDERINLHNIIKEPISSDLDKAIKLSVAYEELLAENQELKKQLDELQTLYNNMFKCHCNRVQVETLLEQQKKFIEYLKNKEKEFDMMGDAINSGACLGILREYKEIIGDKDE